MPEQKKTKPLPLTFGETEGYSKNLNAGRCINMIPGGDTIENKLKFHSRPGLKPWLTFKGGEVRGGIIWEGVMYVVVGNEFKKASISGKSVSTIGTVSSSEGKVWLSYNANGQMLIVAGGKLYLYTRSTNTLVTHPDPDAPTSVNSCTFLDNYGIFTETDTGRVWNTAVNDYSSVTATDFVTAEKRPDFNMAVFADHGELLVFGKKTLEFFYNAGTATATFRSRTDTLQEVGSGAAASPCAEDNIVVWLDDKFQVRLLQGYQSLIISTPAIAYQISQLSRKDDCIGMAYTYEGNTQFVLTFPSANKTFCYNLTMSAKAERPVWFELQSYPVISENRWRGNCVMLDEGITYVGDFGNGVVYTLDSGTYQDNNETLKRVLTSVPISAAGAPLFCSRVWLDCETGVGTDTIEDPQVIRRFSDDGGHTWSNELWRSLGKIGEYDHEPEWYRSPYLKKNQSRIEEFSVTDAVKWAVNGAYLQAEAGIE